MNNKDGGSGGGGGGYDPNNHPNRPRAAFNSSQQVHAGNHPYIGSHSGGGDSSSSGGGYVSQAEVFQKAYAELHDRWMTESHERDRLHRELAVSNARCMKLKGIIEYLEKQAKK